MLNSSRVAVLVSVVLGIFILLLPTPSGMSPAAARLLAVTVLMASLWVTQGIPLAATSLIPLALFPLLGIGTAEATAKAYVSDTLFLYLGGMIIALGIEKWQLHRRLALNLVAIIGTSPRRLVGGFLLATACLSMWISNTACTMLMLPIVLAMLKTLDDLDLTGERSKRLGPPLLLSIAYGSSLGGMTTLVGTPTNNAAVGAYAKLPGAGELTFAQWLFTTGPLSAIYLLITWLVLTRKLPYRDPADGELKSVVRSRLQSLGPASPAEWRMLVVFATTALLWTFRRPLEIQGQTFLPGWSEWYRWLFNAVSSQFGGSPEALTLSGAQGISDTTVALAMAVLLFLIPSGMKSSPQEPRKSSALMDWETANKLPWDMLLLFGGGFALADAFTSTGLSSWMGESLREPLSGQSSWVVIAALTGWMTFLTEFTSNIATVSTLMPTLLTLAEPLHIDPRVILITSTLAASCAFMLPMGTPPNGIVFATGRIPMRTMVAYGILLNLSGIPILTAGAFWIIKPILGIS